MIAGLFFLHKKGPDYRPFFFIIFLQHDPFQDPSDILHMLPAAVPFIYICIFNPARIPAAGPGIYGAINPGPAADSRRSAGPENVSMFPPGNILKIVFGNDI